jgi:predicted patatin/cPLA2 family phospholipase
MSRLNELILSPNTENNLIKRLLAKQQLMAVNDPSHEAIKTALIVGGGGMRGVFSAGTTAGLEAAGITSVFDSAIGISAGACTVAYYLSGQASMGPSIYYEDLPTKLFINLRRPSNIMDIGFLEHVFRNIKPLDQMAIRRNKTKFYIGLTELASGIGTYINVTDDAQVDIIKSLVTSSAIPGIVKQRESINGNLYVDGTTGCTTPIDYAIDVLGATDILVIMNYPPFDDHGELSLSEKLVTQLTLHRYSPDLKSQQLNRLKDHNFQSNHEYPEDINIGVLCPDSLPIGALSKNAKALKKVADDAQSLVEQIFSS